MWNQNWKRAANVLGLLGGLKIGITVNSWSGMLLADFKMYKFSDEFPFYFYPAIWAEGFYPYSNMQNIESSNPKDSAIWTSKATLGKFAKPVQTIKTDASHQTFDIFAFRTIKFSEAKNLSPQMINGVIGTFADELMAGFGVGTTYMPFVTSWLEVSGLKNSIGKDSELLMVVGTDKVDGKNFMQRVLVFSESGKLVREFRGRFVKIYAGGIVNLEFKPEILEYSPK